MPYQTSVDRILVGLENHAAQTEKYPKRDPETQWVRKLHPKGCWRRCQKIPEMDAESRRESRGTTKDFPQVFQNNFSPEVFAGLQESQEVLQRAKRHHRVQESAREPESARTYNEGQREPAPKDEIIKG